MIFCQMKFFSEALGMCTAANVLIPQRGIAGRIGDVSNAPDEGKFKCLYLLHGLSDDESIWMRRTSIERYAEYHGIAVVMPFGEKSFYTDMSYGMNFYTYIAKELPRRIQDTFNVSSERCDNFIAGLSMGGYGALKIGLRDCDRFCALAALSPVTDMPLWSKIGGLEAIFGGKDVPPEDDVFYLAEQKKNDPDRPRVFLAVGLEDQIYDESQKLRNVLPGMGYDFEYRESHGGHEWGFWDEYIRQALDWMLLNK